MLDAAPLGKLHGKEIDALIQSILAFPSSSQSMLRFQLVKSVQLWGVPHTTAEYHVKRGIDRGWIKEFPGRRVAAADYNEVEEKVEAALRRRYVEAAMQSHYSPWRELRENMQKGKSG